MSIENDNYLSIYIDQDVYTINPAFENKPRKVIISIIISQLPIFPAPQGKGLLDNLVNIVLLTYIFAMLVIKDKKKAKGNARPNKFMNENYIRISK